MHKRSRRWMMMAVLASATVWGADLEAIGLTTRSPSRHHTAQAHPGSRRGRPRKFGRSSQPVTLTLPDDVIAALRGIDADLSRAIVRVTQPLVPSVSSPPAELFSYGDRSVIIVRPSQILRDRTGVGLVSLSDGRALITIDAQLSLPQLELRLTDSIDDPALDDESRQLFGMLAEILREARKDDACELRTRPIITLSPRDRPPIANATIERMADIIDQANRAMIARAYSRLERTRQ